MEVLMDKNRKPELKPRQTSGVYIDYLLLVVFMILALFCIFQFFVPK
jgi:hypothetical protein